VDWNGKFWRGVFSDPDGTPSFARIGTGYLIVALVSWDTAGVVFAWQFNLHHLAAGQVPLSLYPDAMQIAAQIGFATMLYGVNKFSAIFSKT
jgi:hypothetical protein